MAYQQAAPKVNIPSAKRVLSSHDVVLTKAGETLGDSEWHRPDAAAEEMNALRFEQAGATGAGWGTETEGLIAQDSSLDLYIPSRVDENSLYVSTDQQLSRFDNAAGHTFHIDDNYIDDIL